MKLWEIKAQALRLMFADTDIQFSYDEFENGSIYDNANTRNKLIRMNDSIARAIELYYQYVGQKTKRDTTVGLYKEDEIFENFFVYATKPSRIDVNENLEKNISKENNIPFFYDEDNQEVYLEKDYTFLGEDITFTVYYKKPKLNFQYNVQYSDLTSDLNAFEIPENVQLMIPYYIKGELYEEDEYAIAQAAKNTYLQFVVSLESNFNHMQSKVRRSKVFDK